MTNLLILVKMQLKEQFNFKRRSIKDTGLLKILLSFLIEIGKFASVTALCYIFLAISGRLHLFTTTNTVPSTVVSIVFFVMLAMSLVSCTIGLTRSLYLSRDNAVLLTLPCKPIQVYLSKLVIFFIFELKRNLSFIVPLFFAYYIHAGYPALTYAWLLVCILLISVFTVAVGALLSIPGMHIANLFRQRKLLQGIVLGATVTLAVVALFVGIALIPENIDIVATWTTTCRQIQDFLKAYTTNFAPLYNISQMMLGETKMMITTFPVGRTLLRFLIVLGVTALFLGAGLLCVRPLFYKMASKPLEHLKRRARPRPNRVLPPRASAVWAEMIGAIKSPDRLFFNVAMLIAPPILVLLLNKIFLVMNTSARGNYMTLAFNVLIILLLVLNANTYASSIYSRDGKSSYLIKTQPTKYHVLLVAKLIPTTIFVGVAHVACAVILLTSLQIPLPHVIMLILAIISIYLAHLFYCADLDLMHPKYQLYASMGSSENNPNETKATLTAFLLSFGVAGVFFLLMFENYSIWVFVKLLIVALAALAWRALVYFRNIKLYYKEK